MKQGHIPLRWTLLAIVPCWISLGIGFSVAYDDWSILHDWIQCGLMAAGAVLLLICAKKMAPLLIGLTRRFLARHWRIIGGVSLLLIILRLAMPCPLRGNYVGSFTAHGCDDRAFLRFADGKITYFHGNSQPEYKGKYQRTGWNTYAWSYGTNDAHQTTITVGWLFIRIYDGTYWLHRDLSFGSDEMVKRATPNAPNQHVDPSVDNVFSLPMKSLIYVSPGSALGHAFR